MLLSPKPHQVEAIEFGMAHPYCIFALQMGTGKSYIALAIHELVKKKTLIICPAYLILNWKLEIEKCLGPSPKVTAITKGSDILKIEKGSDIILISFDLSQKAEHLFEWANTVIIDEAHNLCSLKAKRTQFIHRVIYENSTPRVHLLTGTPIKNKVEEYYSLLSLCNYSPSLKGSKFLEKFPDAITFADHFSHRKQYTLKVKNRFVSIIKWEGTRNVPELKHYLKNVYIRYKSDLKEVLFKAHLISQDVDTGLLKEFEAHYAKSENSGRGSTLKAEAALNKVPFTLPYVKGLIAEVGPVVVFTDHRESCYALAKSLNVPAITGEMAPVQRQAVKLDFMAGKYDVIVATIGSFSTGHDLTRACNLVFNDRSWVPGNNEQAVFRINRMNQVNPCVVHDILGSPVDAHILKALAEKQITINLVT